jgi:hypothetical protein
MKSNGELVFGGNPSVSDETTTFRITQAGRVGGTRQRCNFSGDSPFMASQDLI